MNNNSPLQSHEDNWATSMGAFFPGERVVVRGKNLFEGFQDKSWFDLLLYSITGKEFTSEQIKLFDGIWSICTSYPDPRLWNNRVSALAGTCRSTGSLGLAAGTALSEANIYGMKPIIKSFDFLLDAEKKIEAGLTLENVIKSELKQFRVLSGYGRPIVNEDERIKPLMKLAERLGLDKGKYISLAFEIEDKLIKLGYRMRANIASIAAGLAADQGLTSREYYHYLICCFSIGIISCYIDASEHPEGTFLPLSCDRISYNGADIRKW